MRTICFYFQVHQPFRLKNYRFFDIGNDHYYYDDFANRTIMRKIADKSYLPMNKILTELAAKYGDKFKVAFSISGTAIEQLEMYAPDVIDSFKTLAATGCVEFISETYAHSLASICCKQEFIAQVKKYNEKIQQLFNYKPETFRNSELIYSDSIGEMIEELGFKAQITEGAKHVLGWKSPNYLYCNSINPRLKVLTRNFRLSDDISFRFANRAWDQWPLTTDKYVKWLNEINKKEETVNIFLDYETFGEHNVAETGIFEFMKALPEKIYKETNFVFATPKEIADKLTPVSSINVPYPISWADEERDLTAWLGNDMQKDAFNNLYALYDKVKLIKDENIQRDWQFLQTSNHFYYMSTKWFSDGEVHNYFNPYASPYDAYINYMNILSDFVIRINNYSDSILQVADVQANNKKFPLNQPGEIIDNDTDKKE